MTRPDPHPVEVLVLIGLGAVEALLTVLRLLVLPTLALVVVLLVPRRREQPCSLPAPEPSAAPPAPALPVTPAPCLADVAESLLALPARELMVMAGTRRRLPKAQLTAMVLAMPI